MKHILIFSIFISLLVIFWACSDSSNPITQQGPRNFDPFALWDTASYVSLGNSVQCLAVKDTFLFAGTSNAGVYRSTNNGETWTQINTGLSGGGLNVHALLVKDTVVYAGTNSGVYLSTNRGSNWTSSSSGIGAIAVNSLVIKDSSIYAGTAGVYRSTDNGATWTSTALSASYTVVTLCVKGTRLFAGTTNTANGLYRSTNDGAGWVRIVDGMSGLAVNSLAAKDTNLFAATIDGIFRSSNDSTWTEVDDGLYSIGASPQAFFVYGPSILAGFGNYQGVYLSLNNGASWVSANGGLPAFDANAFVYNGSYLFVGGRGNGTGGAVWRHPL